MIPEAKAGSHVPHNRWFHPSNYFPTMRTSLSSSASHKIHFEPVSIPPISSVAPSVEIVNAFDQEAKPKKNKKQKTRASTSLGPKKPKKKTSGSKKPKGPVVSETNREQNYQDIDTSGINFDFSEVPSPICSCTGFPRMCYKWGVGGWQSSCCTPTISEYPLPKSTTKLGARVPGRKMSKGAYSKLLVKLATEGHDLSCSVDLKDHWARHGTNKFVTIK